MKYIIALLLVLILLSGCVRQRTTPLIDKRDTGLEEEEQPQELLSEEPQEDETLGLSTQEDLFEAIRNSVDEHLGN